jgi:hypothetical protein
MDLREIRLLSIGQVEGSCQRRSEPSPNIQAGNYLTELLKTEPAV